MSNNGLSLARRPWIHILLAANLLAVILVASYLIQAYQLTEREARGRLTNLVSLVRLNLGSLVGGIDIALRTLAAEPVSGAESEARRLKLVDVIAREDPEFRTLVVTNADGEFVGGKIPSDGKVFNIAGRDYFEYLRETADPQTVISGPLLGRSNGKWSLVFARRLNRANGDFAGVVLSGYAVERIAQSFAKLDMDASDVLAIIKADRTVVVFHPGNPAISVGAKGTSPVFEAALANNPVQGFIPKTGNKSIDGVDRMAVYERSADERFYVVASRPVDQVFQGVERQAEAFLLMLVTLLLASVYFVRRALRTERRMRESESRFQSLVENLPGIVYLCDLEAPWRMHYIKGEVGVLTGYLPDEFLNDRIRFGDLILAEDLPNVISVVQQALATGKQFSIEYRIRRLDGDIRWVFEQGQGVAGADGKIAHLEGVMTDVSARKLAEARLLGYQNHLEAMVDARTQELTVARDLAEAGNRAKATFLATISHELRTPMSSIMGMTSLALSYCKELEVKQYLGKVNEAAQQLLLLINDLIEYSRLESDELRLATKQFDLLILLDDVQRQVSLAAHAKGLTLHMQVAPDMPRFLLGDAARLGDILRHIAGNAVKFSDRGSIRINVNVESSDASRVGLRFTVQDTGVGMGEEELARLFQRFEQGDGSLTRKYGGVGLGLASVKRLAELMDGNVGVASVPGQGSTFWVTVKLGLVPVGGEKLSEAASWLDVVSALPAAESGVHDAARADRPGSVDLALLPEICQSLLGKLETGDISARELLRQHAVLFQQAAPDVYRELAKKVDAFDFEQAAALVNEIMRDQADH